MATIDQLNELSKSIPGAVSSAVGPQQMKLQQQLGAMGTQAPVTEASQQLTAQHTAETMGLGLQREAQIVEQQARMQEQQIAEQQFQNQIQLKDKSLQQELILQQQEIQTNYEILQKNTAAKKELNQLEAKTNARLQQHGIETDYKVSMLEQNQRETLAKMGGNIKQQVFDARIQFERDEVGRKFANHVQLADWAVTQARDEQDFMDKMLQVKVAYDRKRQIIETAHKKAIAEETRKFQEAETGKQNYHRENLVKLRTEAEKQRAKEQSGAKNTMMIWQAIGGIAGGVIGAASTAGVGAAGGAALGTAAGTLMGSFFEVNAKPDQIGRHWQDVAANSDVAWHNMWRGGGDLGAAAGFSKDTPWITGQVDGKYYGKEWRHKRGHAPLTAAEQQRMQEAATFRQSVYGAPGAGYTAQDPNHPDYIRRRQAVSDQYDYDAVRSRYSSIYDQPSLTEIPGG